MDLLYAGNLEGFVIVSSDSDFTRLATRLRESGMTVYGLGRRKTPAPFVAAATASSTSTSWARSRRRRRPRMTRTPSAARTSKRLLSTAISSTSKDDGWSHLGEVGSYLSKSHAAFDPRDYGHTKLGELVRASPTSR